MGMKAECVWSRKAIVAMYTIKLFLADTAKDVASKRSEHENMLLERRSG